MDSNSLQPTNFGQALFGHAQLGDKRRTRRLIAIANELVHHPGGTLPHKLRNPADLTALYRLCQRKEVTHEALMRSATQHVMQQIDQHDADVLILHDGSELDYTSHQSLKNLGQLGTGSNRGFIAHHSLAVDPTRREVIGLVSQILHVREKVSPGETPSQKRRRSSRESRLWKTATSTLPNDPKLVDVCDSAADTFEFLDHEIHSGRRFVIRSGYQRRVRPGHDPEKNSETWLLQDWVKQVEPLGSYMLPIEAKPGCPRKKRGRNGKLKHPPRKARTARLLVSATAVRIMVPDSPRGEHGSEPLPVWIVRVWEPDPPAGEEPIEWRLITNVPVETLEDALQIIQWYTCRWIIEEYHKALKTGCGVESLQFHSEDRLMPAIALVSVVAATLLRLRDAGRAPDAKQRPATEVIGKSYVQALSLWRHRTICLDWSVHDFVMALGRLGGHQNRRRDGHPGWLTLWRGWTELVARVDAIELSRKNRSRCA